MRIVTQVSRYVAAVVLCVLLGAHAHAWDGVAVGKVAGFEIAAGQNYAFRVWLNPGQTMCVGGPGWAFLNETDSNYKIYVANLMMAKLTGAAVTIWTTAEGQYCRIGHLRAE